MFQQIQYFLLHIQNCTYLLLQQLKTGFKKTVKWSKYISDMSNQAKSSNLNYLINATFNKINRLFVLSFENEDDRVSYSKYYSPAVEIKDCNVLKSFFDIPKKKQRRNVLKSCRNEQK